LASVEKVRLAAEARVHHIVADLEAFMMECSFHMRWV